MIRWAKATALVLTAVLGIAAVWDLSGPVLIFLASIVVAAAIRAPVDYLVSRGVSKSWAVAGIYLVSLLLLASVLMAAIYEMTGEVRRIPDDYQRFFDYAASHVEKAPWIEYATNNHFPACSTSVQQAAEELLSDVADNHGARAIRVVLGTAFGLLDGAVDLVFIIVLSIYWTIDRDYFERIWLALLPPPRRVSARKLLRTLEAELGAYARSEIAQSLLAGLVLGAGYSLLGVQYPASLALVAALSWLLPWVGVLIALLALAAAELPVLVLEWPGSLIPVVTAALFTAAVFAVLEFCVEPRLFNRRRYNSLFVVLAVMALAEVYGIWGFLLGPMLAVAVQAAVEQIERDQVCASRQATNLAALADRVANARAIASNNDSLPRELSSMVDRLAELIVRAREALGESNR